MDTAQNVDLSPAQRARGVEALYATGHWLLIEERFKDAADLFRAMCMIRPLGGRHCTRLAKAGT